MATSLLATQILAKTAFHISFAFNQYVIGKEFCISELGFSEDQLNNPLFNMLNELGFSNKEIEFANDAILGRMTIEGAPHLLFQKPKRGDVKDGRGVQTDASKALGQVRDPGPGPALLHLGAGR